MFYSYLAENPQATITFFKNNYHVFTKNNYFFEDSNAFTLVPLTIPVEIELSHSADYIYLDKSLVGKGEKKLLLNLNIKKYLLTIFKKGFHPLVQEITITKNTKNIPLALKKITSNRSFTITSSLDEVEVYYDNFLIGYLPYQEKIITGNPYHFTFKKKDYQEKNLVFSFASLRPQNITVDLSPLLSENYQVDFTDLPPDTTVLFFQEDALVAKTQDKQATLVKGQYYMVVENPDYFTYQREINVDQNKTVTIDLISQFAEEIKFLTKKKYSLKENIAFSSLDYNEGYFFISDFSKSLKTVLDNNLNQVEEFSYRNFTSLENSFLDKNIFSPLITFENFILWKGFFYHPLDLSLSNSTKIVFSHWFNDSALLVNQEKAEILVYRLSVNQLPSLLGIIDNNTLRSFKKNALADLQLGQSFFLNSETILFIEKSNQEVLLYHIPSQKISAFVKDFQNKPVIIEGIFIYNYLVFLIIENNQMAIFDQQGNFFTKFTLPDKIEKLFALVIKNNMLYLFQEKDVMVYKLL